MDFYRRAVSICFVALAAYSVAVPSVTLAAATTDVLTKLSALGHQSRHSIASAIFECTRLHRRAKRSRFARQRDDDVRYSHLSCASAISDSAWSTGNWIFWPVNAGRSFFNERRRHFCSSSYITPRPATRGKYVNAKLPRTCRDSPAIPAPRSYSQSRQAMATHRVLAAAVNYRSSATPNP